MTNKSNSSTSSNYLIDVITGATVGVVFLLIIIASVCANKKKTDEEATDLFEIESDHYRDGSDKLKEHDCYFSRLKHALLIKSKKETEKMLLSPLQSHVDTPVEFLYAKLVIQPDSRYIRMGGHLFEDSHVERKNKIIEMPSDIFFKNDEPTKRIFVTGDAAHGKTTYCLWLLQHWYNSHFPRIETKEQCEWEKVIRKFDFVFFIPLRDVHRSTVALLDMICKDIMGINDKEYITWIKEALNSGKYRSLIIIDGLDEWKPDHNVTEDSRFDKIPIEEGITNCVFLITMRPWKFMEVSKDVNHDDCVVQILGLNERGIKTLTKNVLFNYYKMNLDDIRAKRKFDNIVKTFNDRKLVSIMTIPLCAVIFVQKLYKEEKIAKSLSRLYTEMIEILFQRTKGPQKIKRKDENLSKSTSSFDKYKHLLVRLGKIAYEWLMSGTYSIVLPADSMLRKLNLTNSELDLTLNVGLMSMEETDITMTEEVKLTFFHSSLQEFLSAIYIIENEEAREAFLEKLSCISFILEFDSVLTFVSGLNPYVGNSLSQHIFNVANNDTDIRKYRTFSDAQIYSRSKNKVELLYKLQVKCYNEISNVHDFKIHVSDLYVGKKSDTEVIQTTSDILAQHPTDIRSLFLFNAPISEDNGISASTLSSYLDRTTTLQSLCLSGYNEGIAFSNISTIFSSLEVIMLYNITLQTSALGSLERVLGNNTKIRVLGLMNIYEINVDQEPTPASLRGLLHILPNLPRLSTLHILVTIPDDRPVLLNTFKQLSHLHGVHYSGTFPHDDNCDRDIVQTLCTWTELRWLNLTYINLGNSGLNLSQNMIHLETVWLFAVDMNSSAWSDFLQSVLNVDHAFDVHLRNVNINEIHFKKIEMSPELKIQHCKKDDQKFELHFTRELRTSEKKY